MSNLSELIKVSPGFKASVNVLDDFDNDTKVGAYLPTEFGRQTLSAFAASLSVLSQDRSRIIHGNFGSGKSHLALVLARFLSDPWGHPTLTQVLEKVRVKDQKLYDLLKESREKVSLPFLIVRLVGHRGTVSEGLLTALDEALQAASLGSLMQKTAYNAAIERVLEVETIYPAAKAELEKAIQDESLVSLETLKENLRKFRPDTLAAFERIHPRFSAGAKFDQHHKQKPHLVYKAIAEKLVAEERYAGIFVVWDEFGENLRQLATETHRGEYLDLQDFAEACNASRSNQMHFLGLTHRSLGEFISTAGVIGEVANNLMKMAGRFTESPVRTQDGETYRLMDEIVIPADSKLAEAYFENHRNWLERWSDRASELGLFPSLTNRQVLEVISEGCYPLHPATAFCLPELSERVAQNERTLFHFLSTDAPGSLADYLLKTELPKDRNGVPPVFTVDQLWPYFLELIKADSRRVGAGQVWHRYEQTPRPTDALAERVLRVIAILSIINNPKLRPTFDTIVFSLGAVGGAVDAVRDILQDLSSGATRALTFSRATNEYGFALGSGLADLEEELQNVINQRAGIVSAAAYVQSAKSEFVPFESVEPTDHNDLHAINRVFTSRFVTVRELEDLGLKVSGPANVPGDGVALLVLAVNDSEIQQAKKLAESFTNPRVLIGVPSRPIGFELSVRRLDALQQVARNKPEVFGPGKPQYDDWEQTLNDEEKHLQRELKERLSPGDEGPIWFSAGKAYANVFGTGALNRIASKAMDSAFPSTLRIAHDGLMSDVLIPKNDRQATYRKSVINYLFRPDSGPHDAASVENAAEHKVVSSAWITPGFLHNINGKWTVSRPTRPPGSDVWDVIEGYLTGATAQDRDFQVLITQLRNPPYGLRLRTLSLLLAITMQPHLYNLSLTKGGYHVDLSGDILENVVQSPRNFKFRYVTVSENEEAILAAFEDVFAVPEADGVTSRVLSVKSAVTKWIEDLPRCARDGTFLDSVGRVILKDTLLPLMEAEDPRSAVLQAFPRATGIKHLASATAEDLNQAKQKLEKTKTLSEGALHILQGRVLAVIGAAFGAVRDDGANPAAAVVAWHASLSPQLHQSKLLADNLTLVTWAGSITPEATREQLVEIGSKLMRRPLSDWSENLVGKFEGALDMAVRNVLALCSNSREVPETNTLSEGTPPSQSPEPEKTSSAGPDPAPHTNTPSGSTPPRPLPVDVGHPPGKVAPPTQVKPLIQVLVNGLPVNRIPTSALDSESKRLLSRLRSVLLASKSLSKDKLAALILELLDEEKLG